MKACWNRRASGECSETAAMGLVAPSLCSGLHHAREKSGIWRVLACQGYLRLRRLAQALGVGGGKTERRFAASGPMECLRAAAVPGASLSFSL